MTETGQEYAERIDGYFNESEDGMLIIQGSWCNYQITREIWEDQRPFTILALDFINRAIRKM